MEKIFIAIIEFGRTKITGVLASKDNNSSEVAIIGIEEELSENLIEHGVLKGSTSDISFKVKRIIEKLQGRLSQRDNTLHISKVYVCINDYTLSELNSSDAQAIASSTYIKKTSYEKIKKVLRETPRNLNGIFIDICTVLIYSNDRLFCKLLEFYTVSSFIG